MSQHHGLSVTRLYRGDTLPGDSDYDWVVILGGPMSVRDEARHPWLTDEKRFIEGAIRKEKTVLGICLGAQLIADVLGAPVYKNSHKEIGWFPITRTVESDESPVFGSLPKRFLAFHWHGETFDLPSGAVRMAESEACLNQAFLYGQRVIGTQFHLESTRESVEALLGNCSGDLVRGKYIQSPEAMLLSPGEFRLLNQRMCEILEKLSVPWIINQPRS